MTNTGRRDFAARLQQRGRQVPCGDEVEIIAHRLPYETTKEEELSGRGGVDGEGVSIPRERRRGGGGGGSDAGLRDSHGWGKLETTLGPWIGRALLLLLAGRLLGGGGACAVGRLWRALAIDRSLCWLDDALLCAIHCGRRATTTVEAAEAEGVRLLSIAHLGEREGHGGREKEARVTNLS